MINKYIELLFISDSFYRYKYYSFIVQKIYNSQLQKKGIHDS